MAKILVVDDDAGIRELATAVVEMFGYEVASACNGKEGLAKVEEFKPDLVLLDMQLPDMEGMEVLKQLRGQYPSLKVVILSGNADDEKVRQTKTLGAAEYVTKPFVIEELKQTLEKVFKQNS